MSAFLDAMAHSSKRRLERARQRTPLHDLRAAINEEQPRALPDGFLVFAEVKPLSPAEGVLACADPVEVAREYEEGGASAISVLTEPESFGGSLGLLRRVASAVSVPVMRKDFIIDPYQVWEARRYGADGVLAIVRMVSPALLQEIVDAARAADLFVLVEAFDESDTHLLDQLSGERSHVLAGVNSRDLDTLQVRPWAHQELFPHLPSDMRAIAESGLATADDVARASAIGYGGVLIGTSLMRSGDRPLTVREYIGAGRDATMRGSA